MKKSALTILALTIIISMSAQVPQALNYQAVARNSLGQIVPSQSIGVRFTILDATGATLYQETQTTTTNNFGLFTLAIGKGTAVSGIIPSIDWSSGGDKFLKVEIAPQGGTNYTLQGSTQLLSVPYALYSEKTKLIGGNAITITNGNTINANYVAGPGININGNTISATAASSWLLNGNAATTATNFLGTTDNLPLNIRTNNLQRVSISESNMVGTNNISYVSVGQQSNFSTNPMQLGVWGKDISGFSLPFGIAGSVLGMNWSPNGSSTNTMGRLMRLSQWTDNSGNYQFYDHGIDQSGDYYITEHALWSDANILPNKMITISPQNFVGINFPWGQHPTANLHTKGTVRFEGVTTNNTYTRILAMDANGNIATRDASTLSGSGNDWSLTGNNGTTAANFLGTSDNVPLNIRTNNIQRLSISESNISGSIDASYLNAGQQSNFATNPVALNIFGKDVRGTTMPLALNASTAGMVWTPSGGSNNTMGSIMRLAQWPDATQNYHLYDLGIDQATDFFITGHSTWGAGNITPKKMITISPNNFVGVNFNWGEDPTANFHTKGTLRFEGVSTNNTYTRILAMDANGNIASRDASTLSGSGNDWSLTGNNGTTAANFLGTNDNVPLNIRTNNIQRLSISESNISGSIDASYLNAGQQSNFATNPVALNIYGKDIRGTTMPLALNASTAGMVWTPSGGSNNTMGSIMRLAQWPDATQNYHLYDLGIDQATDFFITGHSTWSAGSITPKKMITISPNNFVGINFNWGEDPTANFHTKGTVRFEGVSTNNTFTRILAMDANGNIASRDASSLGNNLWLTDANGIHNAAGNVGIGAASNSAYKLEVSDLSGGVAGGPMVNFNSNDSWQTHLKLQNSNSNRFFSLVVGGTGNTQPTYGVGPNNFGIANNGVTFPIIITSDDKVGIGMGLGGTSNQVKAQLHVKTGDVYLEQIGSGVIMKSPNGQCWRMTVSDAGTPVFTAIPCP